MRQRAKIIIWVIMTITLLFSALISLITFGAYDESRRSEISRAFFVLVTRSIQLSRDGKISGESNFTRAEYRPVWVDPTNDPSAIDCEEDITFPSLWDESSETRVSRSDGTIVLWPSFGATFGFVTIGVIYEGSVENFSQLESDDQMQALFSDGSDDGLVPKAVSEILRPEIERTDETQLYRRVLKGQHVTVSSTDCGTYSFSIFRF